MDRSRGTTPSERLLTRLAESSFLRLWTYPNLYRDQGDGKEVCDLVVVFDNEVLLFSDKEISFPNGDRSLAWQRWRHRAIDASVKQLIGARRWIREHPDRLFVDRACHERLPIEIDPKKARFHLISVVTGAAPRCRAELGGSGSLMVFGGPVEEHFAVPAMHDDVAILVLDEVTTPIVLGELDTIADFVAYLQAREQFLRAGHLGTATGEEEMMAAYLARLFSHGAVGFPDYPGHQIIFSEGLWEDSDRTAYREHVLPPTRYPDATDDVVSAGYDIVLWTLAKVASR